MKRINKGHRHRLLVSAASCLTVALGAVAAIPVVAQGYTTVIATGQVVGTDGKPVIDAVVAITSDGQGFTRTVHTDSRGSFSVPELPPGAYTFTVTADGYDTYTERGILLTAGSASNRFVLSAAGAATGQDITVTGTRVATSDFNRTTTGAIIDVAEVASRVPVARNLQAVIQLAPGTAAGSGAFSNLSSISGGAVSENATFVNGLNITDFRKGLGSVEVPFDFYQTVEVKTGGYAAEFGRSTGGFVNATTKSGSNEFHGGILFSWNPDGLRSRTRDTIYSDNKNSTTTGRTMIAQLSGPIWKDHLFFYGLYQARDNESTTAGRQFFPATNTFLGTSRTFYNTNSPFYGGKIDAVITSGQRLEFTYFNTSGTDYYSFYGSTAGVRYDPINHVDGPYTGGAVNRYGGSNYVARYTGVFTNWLTVSGAYGRNENIGSSQSVNAANSNLPSVVDARVEPSISLTNPGGGVNSTDDVRKFYRGDVDIYVKLFGQHHFKFGYDREELFSDVVSVGSGNGLGYTIYRAKAGDQFNLPLGTDYVRTTKYANNGGFSSLNEAFYIQDSWSLFDNRLNVNLGLRDDRFSNDNAAGQLFYKSGNQWGPRLGFTFDPFGHQTDKVYGSFSRLFLPVAANTNIRLTGGETYYTRTNLYGGLASNNVPILGSPVLYSGASACPDDGVRNCDVTGTGQPVPVESAVGKNLQPQSVDEYILGYEKRVNLWRFGAYLTYTKLRSVIEDSAIDAAVNTYCKQQKIAGCDSIWGGFHQYVLLNPGHDATITLSDPINGESTPRTVNFTAAQLGYPQAKRTYRALALTVKRDFDGVWSLDGSYVLSKTLGNYEGGVKTDNGQSDTGLTTDFDQPGLTYGTYGLSPNDRRHVFKLYGSYQIFGNLNLGLNLSATSPRHYGCIGQVPLSVDPYARAYGAAGLYCQVNADGSINTNPAVASPVKLIQRGSVFTNDWIVGNDLDVTYALKIGRSTASVRLSVFNLLNLQSKVNLNEYGTDGNGVASLYYRTVTAWQPGRSTRIQFSYQF